MYAFVCLHIYVDIQIIFVKYDSHEVGQLPSWPWTQACASHPHTRCTGTWTFNLANAVLPLKYARGDCWAVWPWFRSSEGPSQQGEEDDRSHSGRMCEIGDRCWMASSRVLITYLIFQIGQCEQAVLMRSMKKIWASWNYLWRYKFGSQLSLVWTQWNYSFSLK